MKKKIAILSLLTLLISVSSFAVPSVNLVAPETVPIHRIGDNITLTYIANSFQATTKFYVQICKSGTPFTAIDPATVAMDPSILPPGEFAPVQGANATQDVTFTSPLIIEEVNYKLRIVAVTGTTVTNSNNIVVEFRKVRITITSPQGDEEFHAGGQMEVIFEVEDPDGILGSNSKFFVQANTQGGSLIDLLPTRHISYVPGQSDFTISGVIPSATTLSDNYKMRIKTENPRNQESEDVLIRITAMPPTGTITTRDPAKFFYKWDDDFMVSFAADQVSPTLTYSMQISPDATFNIPDDFPVTIDAVNFTASGPVPHLADGEHFHVRVIGTETDGSVVAGSANPNDITIRSCDLFIKDDPDDVGDERYNGTRDPWLSEAIWVSRNHEMGFSSADRFNTYADNGTVNFSGHQNPVYHDPATSQEHNYVYVQVKNRGAVAYAPGTAVLHLYWAKGSTGLGWVDPWTGGGPGSIGGNLVCGASTKAVSELGGKIGVYPIENIAVGDFAVVEFEFNPENPANYSPCFSGDWDQQHFCLLARIELVNTAPYGMAFSEEYGYLVGTADALVNNVRNNNNIAWKNIIVSYETNPDGLGRMNANPGDGSVPGPGSDNPPGDTSFGQSSVLANFTNRPLATKIAFDLLDENGKKGTFNGGTLMVTLAGKLLENLERDSVQCTKGNSYEGQGVFAIHQPGVGLEHIVLDPRQVSDIKLRFIPDSTKDKGKGYAITVSQIAVVNGADKVIGGQTYVFGQVAGFNTEVIRPEPEHKYWLWIICAIVIIIIVALVVIRLKK